MNKSYPNERDCEHGSMRGKCDICEYEQDIKELEWFKRNATQKIAELESHSLGLTKTLEQFKLEQQVKGLEWVLDCRELNLSNGEIDTIMDKRNRIIKQAAKLKGVSGNE